MDWEDEVAFFAWSIVPFQGGYSAITEFLYSGEVPSKTDLAKSAAAAFVTGKGLHYATGGVSTQVSRYKTVRLFMNPHKMAVTGRFHPGILTTFMWYYGLAYLSYQSVTDPTAVRGRTIRYNAINSLIDSISGTDSGSL